MLRSASVVLLLLVGGCTPGRAGSPEKPAAASTEAPRLGACRQLTPADVAASTNDSAEVGCATEHTAQTFAVGSFPAEVAAAGEESPGSAPTSTTAASHGSSGSSAPTTA